MGLLDRLLARSRKEATASGAHLPTSDAPTPSAVSLDAPEIFDDPYPLYARLRREEPIAPVRPGGFLLTRHADIRAVLTDGDFGNEPSRFSALHARFRQARVAADVAANILPFLDRPAHTGPRRLLAAALRRRLADFEPEVRALAARFADGVPEEGAEVIESVAAPFTRAVMCRLIGLPEADGPELAALTDHFFRLFAPLTDAEVLEEVNRGLTSFRALVRGRLEAAPAGSLLRVMSEPGSDGDRQTEAQVVDSAILLFADGVENVATGAGSVLLAAHRVPDARAALEAGGHEAGSAVSEALRLDSPAQVIARVARRDTALHGRRVAAGVPVLLALGSANRDEDVFEEPDRFRLSRSRTAVLTFGAGRHYCLGAGLAETQIRALASALCVRGFDVRLPADGLRYRRRPGHRWLEALPVRPRTGSGQTTR